MNFSDYIIGSPISVAKALSVLEQNELKVLFLLDDAGRLSGVVTDGDIRRFLLEDGDLSKPVSTAASRNPSFVEGYHEAAARELMEQHGLSCVPMVAGGEIHALVFAEFTLHRFRADIDNPVIIMAGGFGTRLSPYTEILPKPLIPVGNATITERIIERFRKFGCRDVTLVVNHKKNLIKSYFSEVNTDYNLDFVDEDEPLGTAGGLAFFKGRFDKPAFVCYCDNVIEADYRDILKTHTARGNALTMVVAKKRTVIPYGVVETDADGGMIDILEKPEQEYLINAGFYVVSPEFIDRVKPDVFQHITDLAKEAVADGLDVGTYVIDGDCFIDIGQIDDLKELGNKIR